MVYWRKFSTALACWLKICEDLGAGKTQKHTMMELKISMLTRLNLIWASEKFPTVKSVHFAFPFSTKQLNTLTDTSLQRYDDDIYDT